VERTHPKQSLHKFKAKASVYAKFMLVCSTFTNPFYSCGAFKF